MLVKPSNSSLKRCREKFNTKRIGKTINSAKMLLELVPVEKIIPECIYDYDNRKLYNVLLYLIRENCTDDKILKELKKFEYIDA